MVSRAVGAQAEKFYFSDSLKLFKEVEMRERAYMLGAVRKSITLNLNI